MEANNELAHRCSTRISARPDLDATTLEHGEHIEGVELGAGDQQVAEVLVRDLHAHQ